MSIKVPRKFLLRSIALAGFLVILTVGGLLAQTTTSTTASDHQPDPLMPLTRALSDAGATALTTTQQTAIESLMDVFRTSTQTVSAAQSAYDGYIISGDATDAEALIPTLLAEKSTREEERMKAEATFSIGVVNALSSDQLTALKAKFDDEQLVSIIQSLVGGPGAHDMGAPPQSTTSSTTGSSLSALKKK